MYREWTDIPPRTLLTKCVTDDLTKKNRIEETIEPFNIL